MKITSLTLYPVKSLAPVSTNEAYFDQMGPVGDREWMLVDENGKFVSQREIPQLCRVQPIWNKTLEALQFQGEVLPVPAMNEEALATVWNETVPAFYSKGEERAWFQKWVGHPLRLVKMKNPRIPSHGIAVRFPDSMPVLLCNEKSLESLNQQLHEPVGMERFRPNLVVQGTLAFEEDQWEQIQVGEVILQKEKLCSRCSIITVDPKTGARGQEPLKTLASSRKIDGKIKFGIYCSIKKMGRIRVGDSLQTKLL